MDTKLAYLRWAQNVLAVLFNCLRNWKANLCDSSKKKRKREKEKLIWNWACWPSLYKSSLWVGFTAYLRWTKEKETNYFKPPSMPIIFFGFVLLQTSNCTSPPQTLTSLISYTSKTLTFYTLIFISIVQFPTCEINIEFNIWEPQKLTT